MSLSYVAAANANVNEAECLELLTSATVGRIAFVGPGGLRLLPVNYCVLDRTVWFRTSETSSLAVLATEPTDVLFEVDHQNPTFRHGWSVIVSGTSGPADSPTLEDQIIDKVRPWASGERRVIVGIHATCITGRRVRRA